MAMGHSTIDHRFYTICEQGATAVNIRALMALVVQSVDSGISITDGNAIPWDRTAGL